MPQPCPHKSRPTALAEVLMRIAESCIIEQHISKLLKVVEPTNFETPDAAALILRIARGWHLIEHDGFPRDSALFSTGASDNTWRHLIHAIHESRHILRTSSVILSQEGGAGSRCWAGRRAGPRALGPGRRRSRAECGLGGGACSRRAASGSDKGTQSRGGAEENAHRGAPPSQVQRLSARAMQNPRDTELLALSQRACAFIQALASSLNSASLLFALLLGSVPAHTLGDIGHPASTRRADTQARDR